MANKPPGGSVSKLNLVHFYIAQAEIMRSKYNLSEAKKFLNKAREMSVELGDPFTDACFFESLSFCYQQSGEYEEAIRAIKDSIAKSKKLPAGIDAQMVHGNGFAQLGTLLFTLGEYDNGRRYLEQGIEIMLKTGLKNDMLLGTAYGNLGEILKQRKEYKKAINFCEKALKISELQSEPIKHKEVAKNLHNIGDAYLAMREVEKSIQYLEKSARIYTNIDDKKGVAMSYGVLGNNYHMLGNTDMAIRYLQYCIDINSELNQYTDLAKAQGNMALVHKSIALEKLARLEAKNVEKSAKECLHFFKSAIESSDQILVHLREDKFLTGFSDRFYRWYSCLATPFILLGRPKAALLFLDLGKAKILRQLVYKQVKNQIEDGKQSSLESSWMTIENAKEDERIRSLTQEIKMSDSNATVLFYHFNEAKILTIWVLDVHGCVSLKTSEQTSNFHKIHEELEHHMNKLFEKTSSRLPRGYSFFKPSTANKFEDKNVNEFIPGKHSSEEMAGKVTHQDHTDMKIKDSQDDYRAPAKMQEAEKSSDNMTKDARSYLHRALIDPVESLIKGTKLIIVPESCIFFAPFSSFVDANGCLLSEKYQIQIIPSIHVLASSMQTTTSKTIGGSLFVGNPRIDDVQLPPLPSAAEEVKYLASLLDAKPLTEHMATKSKVMNLMSDASIIHFASHGEDGTGHIFLAPESIKPDDSAGPQPSYSLLTQSDVLECKLSARLVVLSCCSSGQGKLSSEGVLGIARSFLGAGASAVLVTLWKINDEFTKKFMKVFYEKICQNKPVCLALKETTNEFQKSWQIYSSFLFWASFEILGEDVCFTESEIEEMRRKNRE